MSPIDSTENARSARRPIAVVTGATGFIGLHLCERLLREGWEVRAVDLERRDALPVGDALRFVQADIRDLGALGDSLRGADAVFHLASAHLQVGAPPGWYESVNVDGVRSLVAACTEAAVRRLVHVSSVGVYGHVEHPPAAEDGPKQPTNEYERTKLLGEMAALQSAEKYGLELVVVRPGWVYGPGCPRTTKLLRTIRKGRFLFVGSGGNLRHPIFVEDCVDGLLAARQAPTSALGRAYLVVGPRAVTVRELVRTAAEVLGVPAPGRSLPRPLMGSLAWAVEMGFGVIRRQPPLSRRSLAFFEHDNAFDGSAAEQHLGFRPQTELVEGLRRTAAALWPREQEVPV